MKKTRITIATEPNCYCKIGRPLPALLWAEIVQVLSEYQKFEMGKKGTRFDTWLKIHKTGQSMTISP